MTTAAVSLLPEYGTGSLADLMPSVAAGQGVPGYDNRLGLSSVRQVVVLLVDGLGWDLLRSSLDDAPFLASFVPAGRSLTCGFPSTTATSMGSFGTGEAPGTHGLLGYTFRLPGAAQVINALTWNTDANPLDVQPVATVFERAAASGVRVNHVALRKFDGSGLTRAALRGATSPGADTMGEAVDATRLALEAGRRSITYVYTGDLDNVGHLRGCASSGWRAQLAHVDLLAKQLAALLPADAVLYVTADHGMVDVESDCRIDVESDATLLSGVHALGGEPRARHVYAQPGASADVLATWQGKLDDDFWVLSRDEAVAAGLFGPTLDRVLPSIGDVVAVARGPAALVTPKAHPMETRLVGHHGALTSAELYVPLLSIGG